MKWVKKWRKPFDSRQNINITHIAVATHKVIEYIAFNIVSVGETNFRNATNALKHEFYVMNIKLKEKKKAKKNFKAENLLKYKTGSRVHTHTSQSIFFYIYIVSSGMICRS